MAAAGVARRISRHACCPPPSAATAAAAVAAAAASVPARWLSLPAGGINPAKYDFLPPLHSKVHDPWTNKGTGFSLPERDRLRIRGLVPPRTLPLEVQSAKVLDAMRRRGDSLDKNMYLADLMDRNETLFFRCLIDNLEEMAPLVYTPTVGVVCQRFGSYYRRARGMYFSSQDRGLMSTMVYNWPQDDVDVIVVTDGSRILGLGDLGANGMGIPIGKLALYVAAGGIDPKRVLPVMFDAGTDNASLRNDPWYLGMVHPRLRGDEYCSLLHEFIRSAAARWPSAVLQFEDFSSDKAMDILEAYRYDTVCFNDDIQGTGAVALASILAAIRTQGPSARLRDQRIVVCGAGSAGLGVAQSLFDAMLEEGAEPDDARRRFWVLDKDGLLGAERPRDSLSPAAAFFARESRAGLLPSDARPDAAAVKSAPGAGLADMTPLAEVVASVKPTILLGLTGVGGTFTERVVREMAARVARPIVLPLSNPTSHAECTAAQAYEWSDGRAIVASGSPFAPVVFRGSRVLTPSQTNNMYIFPGVGLGATAVRVRRITDRMFYAAARTLADMVTDEQLEAGMVLPPIRDIRRVSARVAAAVAASGIADGIVGRMPPAGDLERFMAASMYDPRYQPIVNE